MVGGVVVLVAALVVIATVVAEGEARTHPDRQSPLSPADLRGVRFPLAWRGYAPGHVDALLSRAAMALEEAEARAPSRALPSDPDALPEFIAATLPDGEGGGGEADIDPYAWAWDDPPDEPIDESGQELEDGGGDGSGRLDR